MKVIEGERVPIKMWLDDIEDGALEQVENLARLPFAFKHIAIMPDAHQGYGMPIGGVLATEGVIIPNCIGVDIGCGMCAVRTSLPELDKDSIKKIFGGSKENQGGIRSSIPVGRNRHSKKQDESLMPALISDSAIVEREYENALKQIGTLGGGNHFIEIQKGDDGRIWIMIHSGSRNIGYKVAGHYNKIANAMNEKWQSSVPKKWELAFLPFDSEEGYAYRREMEYCVEFALANRGLMMQRVQEAIAVVDSSVEFDEPINIAHNYAAMEHHFGRNVMVHRKGSTRAREGEVGIIPGSQGTASYIVTGKGNRESFESCSHGAGRRMGRNDARRRLNLAEEKKRLDDMGVVHTVRTEKDLDEAPSAYKDISVVMKNQEDLVDILVELKPLAVIKG